MMNNRVIENEGESEREKGESPPHLIQFILRCRKTDRPPMEPKQPGYRFDGLRGLENLQRLRLPEDEKAKKRRRCQRGVPAVFQAALSIAMVSIGAVNHQYCVGSKGSEEG